MSKSILYGADVRLLPIIDHGPRPGAVQYVVVHDMESDDIDGVEGYFKHGATADAVGAHFGIAQNNRGANVGVRVKVRQWALMDRLVYHAVGGNAHGVGIELCGYARTPRVGWIKRRGQRIALAETIARICHAYGLGTPRHGVNVLGHGDVTRINHIAGGHTDPGPNFPWDAVMALAVKRYHKFYDARSK